MIIPSCVFTVNKWYKHLLIINIHDYKIAPPLSQGAGGVNKDSARILNIWLFPIESICLADSFNTFKKQINAIENQIKIRIFAVKLRNGRGQ